MNDIWYLGDGFWMVYVDEPSVIDDFNSIPALQFITAYYDTKGKKRAAQFKFFQGEDLRPGFCLLHYVSRMSGFDYSKVLDLAKRSACFTYGEFYKQCSYQPELFDLFDSYRPERKKTGTKKTGKRSGSKGN